MQPDVARDAGSSPSLKAYFARRRPSAPKSLDHLAREAIVVVVPEIRRSKAHHDQSLRWNDVYVLPLESVRIEAIRRQASAFILPEEPKAGSVSRAARFPEDVPARRRLGLGRRRRDIADPLFRDEPPPSRHSFVHVELTEPRPIARGRQQVRRTEKGTVWSASKTALSIPSGANKFADMNSLALSSPPPIASCASRIANT